MSDNTMKVLRNNISDSFSKMRDAKVVLPLELFLKLISGDRYNEVESMVPEVKEKCNSIFSDMHSSDNLTELLGDGTYDGNPGLHSNIDSMVKSLFPTQGLDNGPIKQRIIIGSTAPEKKTTIRIHKQASENKAIDYLAQEYGKYLISFNRGNNNERMQKLSVMQKFV